MPISIDNCIFNGELSSGAHLMDGNVIKNKNQLSLLNVGSCKFSTDKNGALKLNGRSYSSVSLDEGKQSPFGAHLAFFGDWGVGRCFCYHFFNCCNSEKIQ